MELSTTKNKEGQVFLFTAELRQILEEQKAVTDALKGQNLPVCLQSKGPRRIGEFKRAWKTACMAAGIPDRIPHDFRRTAFRNLVRAGVPETVAMKMTGHKIRSVFDRYTITSDANLFTAAQRLDEFAAQAKTRAKTCKNPRMAKNGKR